MRWDISSRASSRCAPPWANVQVRCFKAAVARRLAGHLKRRKFDASDGHLRCSSERCSPELAFCSQESAHGQVRERSQKERITGGQSPGDGDRKSAQAESEGLEGTLPRAFWRGIAIFESCPLISANCLALQARAEGDLSERARKRIVELADDHELRLRAPCS